MKISKTSKYSKVYKLLNSRRQDVIKTYKSLNSIKINKIKFMCLHIAEVLL